MNKGIKFALFTALISGLANFANKEIISAGTDPVLLTALKNIVPGIIFSAMALPLIPQIKKLKKNDWLILMFVSLIGGAIPFILFFKGLAMTSAATGSFIHKTMFLWIAILAFFTLKEKFSRWQILGFSTMTAGLAAMIKFVPSFGKGELMIFAATLLWTLETVLVKQCIKRLDYRLLGAARMASGSVFIFIFAGFTGKLALISKINPADLAAIVFVGLILSGYIYFWYRSLALIPATVTSSVLTLAFPITLLLSDFRRFEIATVQEIIGTGFLVLSAYLIAKFQKKLELCPATAKN